ncbi:MAG TPA: hypothetical protein VK213_05990 [Bacteroidales bacterium]|nr:hypothetical protein [Bacteroidales bacterium]
MSQTNANTKHRYRKSEAIRELELLATDEACRKHPGLDRKYIAPRTFRDDSANELTKAIVKFIDLKGGFASRVNSMGVYDRKLGKYRPGTQKKGLADIMATYKGKSLHVEVKYGRDRLSEVQKQTAENVTRSGGIYFVAKDFESFKNWFDQI